MTGQSPVERLFIEIRPTGTNNMNDSFQEAMEDSAAFSNFAQKFKVLIWKWKEESTEKTIDDVALELWEYLKKDKKRTTNHQPSV